MMTKTKLKVSWPRLTEILARRGWNRQTLIRDGQVSESTLDRIQRGEPSQETTVRRLEAALGVERTAFLEMPETKGSDESAGESSSRKPATAVQRELDSLMTKVWGQDHFSEFLREFRASPSSEAYFEALCIEQDPHTALMEVYVAVEKTVAGKANLDILNAIALTALVLFERYLATEEDLPSLSAPNLLLAALLATAHHSSDAVVKGCDTVDRRVSNEALLPNPFVSMRKRDGEDQEWIEIKHGLSLSVDALMESVADLSHQTIRRNFDYRAHQAGPTHITEQELLRKLDFAEKTLGGRFVFFVDDAESNPLPLRHQERIEREFRVKTVSWSKAPLRCDPAHQLERILDRLYQVRPQEETPKHHQVEAPRLDTDGFTTAIKKTTEAVNAVGNLGQAVGRIADKAPWVFTLYRSLKAFLS